LASPREAFLTEKLSQYSTQNRWQHWRYGSRVEFISSETSETKSAQSFQVHLLAQRPVKFDFRSADFPEQS